MNRYGLPENEFDEIAKPTEYVIGRKYHVSWAKSRGMVWILKAIDKDKKQAMLQTPKTKKIVYTQLDSLRDINRYIDERRVDAIIERCKEARAAMAVELRESDAHF